jgi:hypothetical protein
MKKNLIKYSVSVAEYDRNKNEKDTYKIKWTEKEGTTETLINDIKNNRAFCPCFYHSNNTFTNRDKSDNNIKSTHFIIFDMDAVKLTASDFYTIMQSTEIPPSIVYTTANNGKFKPNKNEEYNNRYRVIYALDTPIYNASYYKDIHQALKSEICITIDDNNIYNDNSDSSVSHFYAGCRGGEIYSSDNVISLRWLNDRYSLNVERNTKLRDGYIISREADNNTNNNENKRLLNETVNINELDNTNKHGRYIEYMINAKLRDGYIISSNNKKKEEVLYNDSALLKSEFINDYYLMDIDDIIEKYISIYPSYEFTYVDYSDDDLYYILPNDYMEIKRKWHFREVEKANGDYYKVCELEKCKNGQGRRRRLFINLILRRLIYPQITLEHLLFNALFELCHHIDNSDKKDIITKKEVAQIAVNAYYEDLEKWSKLKEYHKPTFKINKNYCREHNLNARREALKINAENKRKAKIEKWEKMLPLYDITKTDKENINIMANNGIRVSLTCLQEFKKAKGLQKNKKRKETIKLNNEKCNNMINIDKNANKAIERVKNIEMAQLPTNDKKASQGANVAIVEVNKESAQNNIKVMLDGTMREIIINDLRSELFGGNLLTLTNNIIGVRAYKLGDDLRFTMSVINSDLKPSFITTNKKDDVICFYALDSELNNIEYKTISNEICKELEGCINEYASERIVCLVNNYDFERGENFGCIANDIIYNTQWLLERYDITEIKGGRYRDIISDTETYNNEIVEEFEICDFDNFSNFQNNDFWSNKDVLI